MELAQNLFTIPLKTTYSTVTTLIPANYILPLIVIISLTMLISSTYYKNKKMFIYTGLSSIILLSLKYMCKQQIELLTFEPNNMDLSNNSFKTITYNINVLPFSSRGNDYPKLVKYLKDFDIIMIQESFYTPLKNGAKNNFSKSLNQEGYDVLVSPSPDFLNTTQWGDSGLIIAVNTSKLRIIDYEFIPFNNGGSIDSVSQKGILKATTLNNLGDTIVILNTHAQAGYVNSWPDDGLHEDVRWKQLEQMAGIISGIHSQIIFGGDFNFRSEEEIQILSKHFKYSSINSLDAIFTTQQIFTKPEFNNPFGSDHYSVETTILNKN